MDVVDALHASPVDLHPLVIFHWWNPNPRSMLQLSVKEKQLGDVILDSPENTVFSEIKLFTFIVFVLHHTKLHNRPSVGELSQ